jgi:hypothetical protein
MKMLKFDESYNLREVPDKVKGYQIVSFHDLRGYSFG